MGCQKKEDTIIVQKLLEMESPEYTSAKPTDARIQELSKEVRKYKSLVEEKVQATDKLLTYYRMLALAYMDRGMYGPALQALDEAIRISPEQAPLFLYRAISAARLAKGIVERSEQQRLWEEAERAYLRCLEIDSQYVDALYGLSILYVFEWEEPRKAIPYLQRLLTRQTNHVGGMFLLARAYASLGNLEDALAMYDRIINTPVAGNKRDEARKLKEELLRRVAR